MRETVRRGAVQWIAVFLAALMLVALAAFVISGAIADGTSDRVHDSSDRIDETQSFDCVLVLGAGLKADGTPSHMLEDRIKVGSEVFTKVNAGCILMSGDRSGDHYDEPAAMRKYAEELGIDPSLILVDNEGYSTYESITRAKEIYGFDRIIVVTQEYHLYRALYIAEKNGIDAIGVSSDLRLYSGQAMRDMREILARAKDFFACK